MLIVMKRGYTEAELEEVIQEIRKVGYHEFAALMARVRRLAEALDKSLSAPVKG